MADDDPLAGFQEHRKRTGQWPTPESPAISYQPSVKNIMLLQEAYKALGEPAYVRVFWKDAKLAIVPATSNEENTYKVFKESAFSAGWLENAFGFEPEGGWYHAEVEGDILTVDFSDGPFRELVKK